jgi:hypothetical protein
MEMPSYSYRSMDDAPKDGTPIIAVVGGVEMAVAWDDPGFIDAGWFYFDEDEGGTTYERAKGDVRGWRELVFGD